MDRTPEDFVKEFKIRLAEVNVIANSLSNDNLRELLKDATMGRKRKFGMKRDIPIESRLRRS